MCLKLICSAQFSASSVIAPKTSPSLTCASSPSILSSTPAQERALLDEGIRRFPSYAKFYLMMGQLEEKGGHTDAARAVYRWGSRREGRTTAVGGGHREGGGEAGGRTGGRAGGIVWPVGRLGREGGGGFLMRPQIARMGVIGGTLM